MPLFREFNEQINNIYIKFIDKKLVKTYLDMVKYSYSYQMDLNRRLKKMYFVCYGEFRAEGNIPFYTISINKIKKNNKKNLKCIYTNFYEGETKEIKLNFTDIEDDNGIKHNIKELQKIIKIIQYAFDQLSKNLGKINIYKQ